MFIERHILRDKGFQVAWQSLLIGPFENQAQERAPHALSLKSGRNTEQP